MAGVRQGESLHALLLPKKLKDTETVAVRDCREIYNHTLDMFWPCFTA